jgi:hypothetical protein
MSKSHLYIDIRASDEVQSLRFDPTHMTNYYNIPMNMVKFNREVILKHLEYYDEIYIVCRTGSRSSFIKNKYFKNEPRVKVDTNLSSINLKLGKQDIVLKDNTNVTVWTTGKMQYNLYNITRVIQIMLGLIMLTCGLFLVKNKHVNIVIKVVLIGMGLMALFNGLTNTCTLSVLLRNIMN